jgi:L-seryl-tRNA(Ser) seleniumtransferase
VVALRVGAGAEALAAGLRAATVPVVSRIREGAVLLDARTLLDGDEALVASALEETLARGVV